MKRIIGAALIAVGAALLAWTAYWAVRPATPYALRLSPAPAGMIADVAGFGVASASLQRVEVASPDVRKPVATGLVARDEAGRLAPLDWRNDVTEPIFFADIASADALRVLNAIREHVPNDAVVLAWWDFSRLIRSVAQRAAPLDDPQARGLRIPAAWAETARESERARWGAGAPGETAQTFDAFIDALLADEAQGATMLARLAKGQTAYIAVHLADIWKTAAARPEGLALAYRDFASASGAHGVMKAATHWMQEQKMDGGYAVEPIGAATRLHYLMRKSDTDTLIARLLPFSTSNPLRLERLQLVFQHKGYWIYKLNAAP